MIGGMTNQLEIWQQKDLERNEQGEELELQYGGWEMIDSLETKDTVVWRWVGYCLELLP